MPGATSARQQPQLLWRLILSGRGYLHGRLLYSGAIVSRLMPPCPTPDTPMPLSRKDRTNGPAITYRGSRLQRISRAGFPPCRGQQRLRWRLVVCRGLNTPPAVSLPLHIYVNSGGGHSRQRRLVLSCSCLPPRGGAAGAA